MYISASQLSSSAYLYICPKPISMFSLCILYMWMGKSFNTLLFITKFYSKIGKMCFPYKTFPFLCLDGGWLSLFWSITKSYLYWQLFPIKILHYCAIISFALNLYLTRFQKHEHFCMYMCTVERGRVEGREQPQFSALFQKVLVSSLPLFLLTGKKQW